MAGTKDPKAIREFKELVSGRYKLTSEWLDEKVESIGRGYIGPNKLNDPDYDDNYDFTEMLILGGQIKELLITGNYFNSATGEENEFEDVEWYLGAATKLILKSTGALVQQDNCKKSRAEDWQAKAVKAMRLYWTLLDADPDRRKKKARIEVMEKYDISERTFYIWQSYIISGN